MPAVSDRLPARRAALALLMAFAAAAPSSAPPPAVTAESLDLARFGGRWYVIAARGTGGPQEAGAWFEYEPIGDRSIRETYGTRPNPAAGDREVSARTGQTDPAQPSRWIFRRGWFGSEERRVLYVSPDYRYALQADATGRQLWVLARQRQVPEWSYAGLLARLALAGVDVKQLERVEQPD